MVLDVSDFQTLLEQALREALSPPRGASHLAVPSDVSAAKLPPETTMPTSPEAYRAQPAMGAPEGQIHAVLEALVHANKPLLFLGNGCRPVLTATQAEQGTTRLEKLIDLCERWAIPVATNPDGKGVFPESHPLSLRAFGKASSLWAGRYLGFERTDPLHGKPNGPQVGEHDAMVVLGSSLRQLATEDWSKSLNRTVR